MALQQNTIPNAENTLPTCGTVHLNSLNFSACCHSTAAAVIAAHVIAETTKLIEEAREKDNDEEVQVW